MLEHHYTVILSISSVVWGEMPLQTSSMEIICGVCPKILCETNLILKSLWIAVEREPQYTVFFVNSTQKLRNKGPKLEHNFSGVGVYVPFGALKTPQAKKMDHCPSSSTKRSNASKHSHKSLNLWISIRN